jgi:hypothetical protein
MESAPDGGFKVFGPATAGVELGEGTFDDPAAREDFGAHRVGHAPDDFDDRYSTDALALTSGSFARFEQEFEIDPLE